MELTFTTVLNRAFYKNKNASEEGEVVALVKGNEKWEWEKIYRHGFFIWNAFLCEYESLKDEFITSPKKEGLVWCDSSNSDQRIHLPAVRTRIIVIISPVDNQLFLLTR